MNGQRPPGNAQQASYAQAASRGLSGGRGRGLLGLVHWGLEPPVPSVIQKPREEAPVNVPPVVKEPQVQAKQQAKKSNDIYVAKDSSMPAKQQTKKNQDACGKGPVLQLQHWGLEPPVPSVIQKPREEAPVNVTPVVKEPQVQAKQQAKKSNNIYVAKDSSMPAKQQTKKNQDTCGKDPVSGLNEYCQKNHKLMPTFEVVSQSGPPHDPTFTMMTMIGNKRFPKASAKSKAEAKKMAAAHACNILHVSHGYQRVKAEETTKSSSAPAVVEKHPISELFEYTQATKLPQPREILLREYGPAHSKKFFIQFDIGGVRYKAAEGRNKDEARKLAALHALDQLRSKAQKQLVCDGISLPKGFGDRIAERSWNTYRTLCTNIREMFTFSGHVILSCFLLEDKEASDLKVVSLGTGNRVVTPQNLKFDGNIVLDSHAEIVARRGLLVFLYQQLTKYVNRVDSILTTKTGAVAVLKDKYRLHLYISTAPCGDAAVYSHAEKTKSNESISAFDHGRIADLNPQRGEIRTKVEGGEGTIPTRNSGVVTQTIDGIQMGNRMRVASCSDKILKWNVLGVQGALLSKFMEPLFISSVTLSDLYEPKHLSRALCCRMPLADGSKQVPAYVVNHPEFYFGNIVDAKRVMETEATKKTKSWSLYWSRDQLGTEYNAVRVIDYTILRG